MDNIALGKKLKLKKSTGKEANHRERITVTAIQ